MAAYKEPWELMLDSMVANAAQEAFDLMRQGALVHLYYRRSGPDHYGELIPVSSTAHAPQDAGLVLNQKLPGNKTLEGLRTFIYSYVRKLEILPSNPKAR